MASQKKAGLGHMFFESKAAVLIIALNVYAFFLLRSPQGQNLFESLVLYPGNLLQGRFWCLVTSGFLHSDGVHLGLNMLGVWIFGRIVERHLGMPKTMLVYMGSLILSMSFSTAAYVFIFHKNIGILGASGAVMGLMGAAMLLDPFCVTYEMILPIPLMVKGWMFLSADLKGFLGGEKDGISHLAHLFGFLSVAFLVYFLSKREKRVMRVGLVINMISFAGFLFLRNWLLTNPVLNHNLLQLKFGGP